MIFKEYIDFLAETINGKTHKYYARTVKLADLYMKLVSGEDMDSLMRQFVKREDDELFKQRKEITQHITASVADNIIDIFNKIPRSNSMNRILKNDNEDKLDQLVSIMSKFWGIDSLDDYIAVRWLELNFIDPNTFVVIEWKDFDENKEYAQPYPFEVKSSQAVNYLFKNKVLQWLISKTLVKKEVEIRTKLVEKELEVYTVYFPDHTIKATQELNEQIVNTVIDIKKPYRVGGQIYFKVKKGDKQVWHLREAKPHNLGYVPAFRVGYKRDQFTDGNTFVNPFHAAISYFKKMIKTVSEMDLTMALHAFPQKLQYVKRCTNKQCHQGLIQVENGHQKCGTCKGNGYLIATTAQESILLPLPPKPEDMIDLTKMVYYAAPPVDLIKFQHEYIQYLTDQTKRVIFNTDIFTRQQIAETATGKNIDLQNIYDTLFPCAKSMGRSWNVYVKTVSLITDLNDGLIWGMFFSKDFKLKTLDDLYSELDRIARGNASTFIKQAVEDDIARIIYSENPAELIKYQVQKKFYPFPGLSKEQIYFIFSQGTVTNFDRVFWSNYGGVFQYLELNVPDFYILTIERQWQLIEERVNEIAAEVISPAPELEI